MLRHTFSQSFSTQVDLNILLGLQIFLRNLTTEEVAVFTNEDWLSKTKGPKRTLICEMTAVVDDEEMVERTTYIIQVKTSDVTGWCSTWSMQYTVISRSMVLIVHH